MYPNPQDVLPLPPRPDLGHYRKRAKDLAKACRSAEPGAVRAWAERWIGDLLELNPDVKDARRGRDRDRRINQLATFAHDTLSASGCALSEAQFVIARAHGFESWPKLVHHLEGLGGASPVSAFEEAADAIASGDIDTVHRLLHENPQLVRDRSTREHRATLLHYVSANGVENYRQESPPNIVDIARLLLDAGAEVNAGCDVYGGGATTLGLVVTSGPPRVARVQIPLAELLIARGARVDPGSARACLVNGCPEAAAYLVERGLTGATLEEAAGIGRLDLIDRRLASGAVPTDKELDAAIRMACWYGRVDVVEYLLDRGADAIARDPKDGDTALHIASYTGSVDVVKALLRRGGSVNVIDAVYKTPPLVWALHAWLVESRRNVDDYRAVIRALVEAGAEVRREWIDDDRLREDENLYRVLVSRVEQ
jgi:hypothetical protein